MRIINTMEIKSIRWQDALPIRHKVLWPSKEPNFCRVPYDDSALHYGVFIQSVLVSVASVYLENNKARLRKFATLENYQKQGLGSKLLSYIIEKLSVLGIEYFWCDARVSAVPFYNRFGMQAEGEEFFKSDIAYVRMAINLKL